MTEADIWGTTRKMVELYGVAAHHVAVTRAERLMMEGIVQGSTRWHQISFAIRGIQARRAEERPAR